jgi:F0F1-type ATP synthase assembly protein I
LLTLNLDFIAPFPLNDNTKPKKKNKAYLKYTGMLGQLFFLMLLGVYLGKWLDKYFDFNKPYLTVSLIILFFIGFIVKLYYDLTREE